MSSESGASAIRGKCRADLALAVLVILLLIALAFLARNPPRTVPGFDLLNPALRFVGVRPDAGDLVYDAGGKTSFEEPYEGTDLGPWSTNMLRRDFIFELEAGRWTNAETVFSFKLGGFHTGDHKPKVYHLSDGRVRLVAEMQILRAHHQKRFIFKPKPAPTKTVDISLSLVEGSRLTELARCRGVRVTFPELPYRSQSESLERLAARLHPTVTNTRPHPLTFQSSTEALEALDVVRGPYRQLAWQAINRRSDGTEPPLDLGSLDPALQAKVRQTAWAWSRSVNEETRRLGVMLGLKGPWPEFMEPAMQLLSVPTDTARAGAIQALMLMPKALNAESILKLEKSLQPFESISNVSAFVKVLAQTGLPEAREVLVRLASHRHPRVWRQTLQTLEPSMQQELARGSPTVGERLLWLTGHNESMNPEEQSAAWRRLPEQLTPELKAQDLGTYLILYRSMVRHVDPKLATPVIIALLRSHDPTKWDPLWMTQAVRHLNRWHGTDFGGLGTDIDSPAQPTLTPEKWAALLEEISQWWETRSGSTRRTVP